jgi:TRAP-type C4-dicarboxylate transport system permease small subunit
MDALAKIDAVITKLVNFMVIVLFTILTISCILQVFTRYVLNDSLFWTEELARYTYIWSNLLAASMCVKAKGHATVTMILDMMTVRVRRFFSILINLVMLWGAAIMVIYGYQVANNFMTQFSPALKIPMFYYYIVLPISGVLMIFYVLSDSLKVIIEIVNDVNSSENKINGF